MCQKSIFQVATYAPFAACSVFSIAIHAETAEMLPAGIAKVRYQYTVASADEGFDSNGKRKDLGVLYREALEKEGLTTSVPSVYDIQTDAKVEAARQDLYLQYGVTDDFGLGLWTYYVSQKASYSANLQQDVGWGALSGTNQSQLTAATTAADTADGSVAALGDTVIGYKHRLLGSTDSTFRFAYTLGARLPTGHVADPTKKDDLSTGDGQTDVGIWLSFDWVPASKWLLNLHTRHEYQLAGERDVLDPSDSSRTLSREFQPGFYNMVEVKSRYRIPRPDFNTEFELTATYEHTGDERKQAYNSSTGRYEGDLKSVTNSGSSLLVLEAQAGIDFFPSSIPLALKFYYGMPVSGQNAIALNYYGIRCDAYW